MENQILHCTIQNDVVKSPSFWINSSDCTNGTGQSHTISMTEYYFSLLMYPLIHTVKFLLRSMVTLAETKIWIIFENDYLDSLGNRTKWNSKRNCASVRNSLIAAWVMLRHDLQKGERILIAEGGREEATEWCVKQAVVRGKLKPGRWKKRFHLS